MATPQYMIARNPSCLLFMLGQNLRSWPEFSLKNPYHAASVNCHLKSISIRVINNKENPQNRENRPHDRDECKKVVVPLECHQSPF
jgi:hypothetical protein